MGKKMNTMYEKDTGGQASNKSLALENRMSYVITIWTTVNTCTRVSSLPDHELTCSLRVRVGMCMQSN